MIAIWFRAGLLSSKPASKRAPVVSYIPVLDMYQVPKESTAQ